MSMRSSIVGRSQKRYNRPVEVCFLSLNKLRPNFWPYPKNVEICLKIFFFHGNDLWSTLNVGKPS